jgi:hypothetical protein
MKVTHLANQLPYTFERFEPSEQSIFIAWGIERAEANDEFHQSFTAVCSESAWSTPPMRPWSAA